MSGKRGKTAAKAAAATAVSLPARVEYSREIVDAICARIAEGETATAALEALGVPRRTFFGWVQGHREAAELYETARRARAELNRDRLDELNAKLEKGLIDPQSARVVSENLKWVMAKDAAVFGDKVEVTGKDGKDLIPDKQDDLELARYIAFVLHKAETQLENAAAAPPLLLNGGSE